MQATATSAATATTTTTVQRGATCSRAVDSHYYWWPPPASYTSWPQLDVVSLRRGGLGLRPGPVLMAATAACVQDMECLLYEAIRAGEIRRVKRMVNSCIGCNAILHTPSNWESATVLGTAAYFAKLPIVDYLLGSGGCSINFQDPGMRRNALHWACMSCSTEMVRYLIDKGADINALDRDNMSPVMVAALHGHQGAVELLVTAGASVTAVDRLRCSALHYATFHDHRTSVRALILGGCVLNNSIFVKGTPLGNLACHDDSDNVRLMLAAGCHVTAQQWRQQCQGEKRNMAFVIVDEYVSSVPSLRQACRMSIRRSMNGQGVQKKIAGLPLPSPLIDFLLLIGC